MLDLTHTAPGKIGNRNSKIKKNEKSRIFEKSKNREIEKSKNRKIKKSKNQKSTQSKFVVQKPNFHKLPLRKFLHENVVLDHKF